MPDADLGEFVMPEPPRREILRGVTVLDENRSGLGAYSVNLLLHEPGNGREIATFLQFVEPSPKRPNGASRESGQVIDSRDTKLVHKVQELDVAVLEFKSVFRRH